MRFRSFVAAALLAVVASFAYPSEKAQLAAMGEKWRTWLDEEVYPIITSEQRKAFLALETEEQRREFAERLWELWGAQSGYGRTFRQNYEERLNECRANYDNTTEDRCRVLLLHGPPDARQAIDCPEVFVPLEFWSWARIEGLGQNVTVLFFRPYGLGRFRLWEPFETRTVLYSTAGQMKLSRPGRGVIDRPETQCGDPREILGLLATAEYWLSDITTKTRMAHAPEPEAVKGKESSSARFLQFSTILPQGAKAIDFNVSTGIGSRSGSKVRVMLSLEVPRGTLGATKVGDMEVVQLDVVGEISREGEMMDRFRYAFTFPATSKTFPVAVERELRPGKYHARLKVQDSNSSFAGVREVEIDVIPPPLPTRVPAEDKQTTEAVRQVVEGQEPTVSLRGPEGEGVTGVQRFTALVGPKVGRVEFFLDGKPVLTKNRPPFEVELDLGPLPRLANVTAVAFDETGKELDRRQIDVNVGRERFLVRLQPVSAADRSSGKVRAVAAVNVPPDRKLVRFELYWNDTLAATLYQPPFRAWISVEDTSAIGYLRGLATLDDGAQAEDIEFVNAPQFLQNTQVQAVELPVTVLDKEKKPVEGLKEKEFSVFEEGVPQSISHFAIQQQLPIRLGLVIDTSGSMEKTLPEVQRVVLGFLRSMLRPRDRAFVVAFSDRPALLEGFTADFGALERALIALRADRETALYDSVVYSLFQFSGVHGRKALVILTDGEDNASRMDFDKMMDYAQRSGVTIYTIGIDLSITKVRIRSQLSRLARSTGGESFFLARAAALTPVYDQINRELRSQYLIAYTSTSGAPSDTFRKVAVKVQRPGVEVRTIAGYFPGS